MNETLTRSALNSAIVDHLAAAGGALGLGQLFAFAHPGQAATYSATVALRKRLNYLTYEGRLLTHGQGEGRTWSAPTRAQLAAQARREAEQAAPVALPRHVNVMAGIYLPPPGPALRAGADHRHIPSRGFRC